MLVLAVVATGAFAVSRLHTIFGSVKESPYSDTQNSDASTKPASPKRMTYEVSGPPGTLADVSYFDGDGNPKFLKSVSLPWSLQIDIGKATAVGSVIAQGDSDSISCRILVDQQVKAEKTSNEVNALTSCLLKAA